MFSIRCGVFLVILSSLLGCSTSTSDKRYHLLDHSLLDAAEFRGYFLLTNLVLGKVSVVDYLSTRSIVNRENRGVFGYKKSDYWAYSFEKLVADFNYDYLKRQLEGNFWKQSNLQSTSQGYYILNIWIDRLDGGVGMNTVLKANMHLNKNSRLVAEHRIEKTVSLEIKNTLDLTKAHTLILAAFLKEVIVFLEKNQIITSK